MMNLTDTIKALEEKYSEKKEEKPYIPSYTFVSLVFQTGSDLEKSFLVDLDGLEFKKVLQGRQAYYQSTTLERMDAQKVEKLLGKKRYLSNDFLGSKIDDGQTVHYSDVIKQRQTVMSIAVYSDSDREKNIKSDKETEDYYLKLEAFEKRLVGDSFQKEFCSNLVYFLCENFDTTSLVPHFKTDDSVTSLVNDIFNFTLELTKKNFVIWHSSLYPHLYNVEYAIDYRSRDVKDLLGQIKDKADYKFYDNMVNVMNQRFSGVEHIEPLYNYKNIVTKFPKNYDESQITDDSYNINYWLSRDHIVEKQINPLRELIAIISKAAIYYSAINNAHDLHVKMSENNATSTEMEHIVREFFKDRVDWKNWETILKDKLTHEPVNGNISASKKKIQP